MSNAQERAVEVISAYVYKHPVRVVVHSAGPNGEPGLWANLIDANGRYGIVRALAEANLLVDDDTARLVERGRQAEEADAHVDELLASVTDEDREQLRADIQRQARHLALGRAVEAMKRLDESVSIIGNGMWNACLDAIYREAGVGTPPETQDRSLSARLPVGNPSDGPVVPQEPSEGDTGAVSGGAG